MGCNCGATITPSTKNVVTSVTEIDSRTAVVQFRTGVTVENIVFQPSERVTVNYATIRAILESFPAALYFINPIDRHVFVMVYPQYLGYAI